MLQQFSGQQRQPCGFSLPPAIFSQVPTGTSTKDCGSASTVDLPAQSWAPALQSFLAAFATPKHCSVSSACANFSPVIESATASAEATISVFFIEAPSVAALNHRECYHEPRLETTIWHQCHAVVIARESESHRFDGLGCTAAGLRACSGHLSSGVIARMPNPAPERRVVRIAETKFLP